MIQSSESDTRRNAWKRSEARTIRPFRDVTSFLADLELRYAPNLEFSADEHIGVRALPASVHPALRFAEANVSVEHETGIPAALLEVVVILEHRFFKTSKLLQRFSLDSLVPGIIEIEGAPTDRTYWSEDASLRIALVLREGVDRKANTAYRKSSWLAEKRFGVSRAFNRSKFDVRAVPEEYFVNLGLPAGTTWNVKLQADGLTQSEVEIEDALEICVREDLVQTLEQHPDSPITEALYLMIAYEAITMVLTQGARVSNGKLDDKSVLQSVVAEIADELDIPPGEILRVAIDPQTEFELRSIVQAYLNMSKTFLQAGSRAK